MNISVTQNGLKRELTKLDAISIVFACVIGSGIFIVPQQVANFINSPIIVIIIWVLCGILCFLGSLCIARLSNTYEGAGGLYTYFRRTLGKKIAFLYSWSTLIITTPAVLAALATILGRYFVQLFGVASDKYIIFAVISIIVMTVTNSHGVKQSKWMLNVFNAIKLTGIALILLSPFFVPFQLKGHFSTTHVSKPDIFSFASGFLAIVWTYDGWSYLPFSSGEIKNPRRSISKALAISMALVLFIYVLLNVAYYSVLSVEEIKSSVLIPASVIRKSFGSRIEMIGIILLIFTLLGSLNALFMTGSRCFIEMKRDKIFFKIFGKIDTRSKVPQIGILAHGIIGILYVLFGGFYQLLSMIVIINWVFYGMSAYILLTKVFRRDSVSNKAQYSSAVPVIFGIFCVLVVSFTILASPLYSLYGVIICLLGIPVYYYFHLRNESTHESKKEFEIDLRHESNK
jgi:APA family basic amino acid/polyamine antiporter